MSLNEEELKVLGLTEEDLKSPHFAIGRISGVCDAPESPSSKIERIREILQDFKKRSSEGTST